MLFTILLIYKKFKSTIIKSGYEHFVPSRSYAIIFCLQNIADKVFENKIEKLKILLGES